MTPFLQYLADKQLPGYALVKNAVTQFVPGKGYQMTSFEEASWSTNMDELVVKIPKPVLQNTRDAREYAGYRFSPEELKAGDFHFDTMPSALLNEANDTTVFGESYTILWVAEPEDEWLQKVIIDRLNEQESDSISGEVILKVWEETIDRVFFRSIDEQEEMMALVFDELINNLIDVINQLPNAPEPSAWDVLGGIDFSEGNEE
jgi:hypothetical protein